VHAKHFVCFHENKLREGVSCVSRKLVLVRCTLPLCGEFTLTCPMCLAAVRVTHLVPVSGVRVAGRMTVALDQTRAGLGKEWSMDFYPDKCDLLRIY